ncbi:MAG: penicillin acylase family protein [Candidatus Binatia bacterium]
MALGSLMLRPLLRRWSRKATPQMQGSILIPGLEDTAKVLWGPYATPHLSAANEHDLFMAQGYLHAQERLWQMDFNRNLLSGRLAEILGDKPLPWKELSARFEGRSTADLDHFIRLMGIRKWSSASLSLLPQALIDRLMAYSKGVNRYIETHLKCLPLEFRLLRYLPDPWQPEDSLLVVKGFALFLSTSLFTRLTLNAVAARLQGKEEKLKSLFPTYPQGGPIIARSASGSAPGLLRFLNGTFQEANFSAAGQGSNNWVIAPWRSVTGNAILCNDPHLRMTLPAIWYLMHLKCAPAGNEDNGLEVWGASLPGSPYVHLGRNRRIAWGATAALCDDMELYRERIHRIEPDLYLANDQWVKMEYITEKIRIRRGKEINKTIRLTRHGPLINDFMEEPAKEDALALKWIAHAPSQELRALDGTNRARDWDEFLKSLTYQDAPTLNYVFADTQGNIGYCLAGKVPIRSPSPSLFPIPGWTGEFEWKGTIPFEEMPRIYNPPEGVIATANNRITDDSYPYYLSDLFDPPYRIRRIKELLTSKRQFRLEDMPRFQKDTVSLQGKKMIHDLRTELEEIARNNNSLKEAVEGLIRWDGNCSEDSFEATLYHALYQHLMENLLTPDLGKELYLTYAEIFNQSVVPIDRILQDPQSPWFDPCPRGKWIEKGLREAMEELTDRFGADMKEWRWGKLHTRTLHHPFGRSKLLAPLFSVGPSPSAGDGVTINMGFYRRSDPYEHVVGASLRMVIDLGDPRGSRFVLPSGQSGHIFSPHYRNQTELWQSGDTLRLFHEEKETKEWPILTLTPFGEPEGA